MDSPFATFEHFPDDKAHRLPQGSLVGLLTWQPRKNGLFVLQPTLDNYQQIKRYSDKPITKEEVEEP